MNPFRQFAVLCFALTMAAAALANDLPPDALIEGRHWKRLNAAAEKKLRAAPNDAQANYWMGFAKFEHKDYDGAEPLAEKAVSLDSQNADYHYLLGIIYGRKAQKANIFSMWGLARKFKKELETAMVLDPRHVDSRMAMIDFHLEAPGIVGGDKKKASELAEEILKIDPARGWLAKARIAQKENRSGEMESLYLKAVEADGRDYRARMALASFYSSPGKAKHDLIEKHAREAASIAPGRIAAYSQLAALYAYQQRWRELDAILTQAEKNVFDDLSPYFYAARNLIEKNTDLPRAERFLRKYLSQPPEPDAPSPAEGHWRLGQALEKQNRNDEAIREYQEAVRLDSDLDDARKDLKRLKR